MSYKALYRTYRPQTFEEVVGQDVIVKTLQNSILNNKIGHAYLFCGPRGTGKTSIARIFAKTLNCPNTVNAKPCNECSVCKEITSGTSPDVIEIDAASNSGVDEIRELRDKINFLPAGTKYRVYIIDEVHMLSNNAFNALLKTLEEPPAHAIFILATTDPKELLPTIISRCQRFDFKSLTNEEIYKRLEMVCNNEEIKFEEDALMNISIAADGGMRDALSMLDQAISLSDDVINDFVASSVTGSVDKTTLLALARNIEEKNITESLKKVTELQNNGRDTQKITNGLLGFYRDVLMCKANVSNEVDPRYREFADQIDIRKVYFNIDALNDIQSKVRGSNTPSIYLEVGIIKMISASAEDLDYGKRIFELEQKLENYEPGDSSEGSGVDVRRLRILEEKYDNLIAQLSKYDLGKLSEKVQELEDNKNNSTSSVSDNSIKELVNHINRINEDLQLLNVTQENLRNQINNASTGGIDDDVLTERIEANLKKVKMPINYSEVEAYVDKKISEIDFDSPSSVVAGSYDSELENKVEELLDKDENYQEAINQLKEKFSNLEKKISSMSVSTGGFENDDMINSRIDQLESRIDEINASLEKENVVEANDDKIQDIIDRLNELETMVLSIEDKPSGEKVQTVIPSDIESKLEKMESNIYKIMSGMLNPQPTKKVKTKVDDKQISIWSNDIVDFDKVEKPSEVIKADFEDLSMEDEDSDEDTQEVIENVEEESTDSEEIVYDEIEETEDDIETSDEEETIEFDSNEVTEEFEEAKTEETLEETSESEESEDNLFSNVEEEKEPEPTVVEEEYTPLFEENLEDYYSQSEEEKEEIVEDKGNLFDEATSSNETNEEIEENNEEIAVEEESEVIEENLETSRIEEEKRALEEKQKLEAQELERQRREAQELERQKALQEAEQKQEELRKVELARSNGGDDLTEYERYDVKVLERILNDSRNQECREDLVRVKAAWRDLKILAPVDKRGAAESLAAGEVAAVGNHEIVLWYKSAAECNAVMSRKFKKISLKLLYDILGTDYNYFAITNEAWLEKVAEYKSQYSMGYKNPTLTPISDPDLRIVIDDDEGDGEPMIKKNMGLFGNNLNIK